jgi:hypothetical protein
MHGNKGKKQSLDHIRKRVKSRKHNGTPWSKPLSNEYKKKISDTMKQKNLYNENNPNWKGESVKYDALHSWVYRHLGKPLKCEHCKTETAKKFEWANKSGKYKRILSDWIRLCTKCHIKFDKKRKKHQRLCQKS